jgi:hypothetical protein
VELDFGLSHFTVDLAVRMPGSKRWQVAVLLDSPAWAARPTVADRDAAPRLLDTMMRWSTVVRVWLPQWINDRAAVLLRIDEALAKAAQAEASVPTIEADNPMPDSPALDVVAPAWPDVDDYAIAEAVAARPEPVSALQQSVTTVPPVTPASAEVFVPYVPTLVGTRQQIDELAHDGTVQQLVRQSLEEVVTVEAPIEVDRLSRLVHKRFDLHRVSADRRSLLMRYLPDSYHVTPGGTTRFVWPPDMDPNTWHGFRRTQDTADRAFHEIAPEEIANAMRHAIDTEPIQDTEQLQRITVALLGYRRRSQAIEEYLRQVLDWGVAAERLPSLSGDAH